MSYKNNNMNNHNGGASKATLFLGDLSSVCTEEDIEKIFSPYGKIRHIRIQRSPGSFSSLGYGFIRMGSQMEALNAKDELNGILICGRKVRIREAAFGVGGETANKPPPKNSLFVRFAGVDRFAFTNEEIIREIYSSIGTISDVSIRESKYDKKSGIQKGYGFVHFDESRDGLNGVEAALNAVVNNPQMLIDNVLYICEVSRNLQAQLNNNNGNNNTHTNTNNTTNNPHRCKSNDKHGGNHNHHGNMHNNTNNNGNETRGNCNHNNIYGHNVNNNDGRNHNNYQYYNNNNNIRGGHNNDGTTFNYNSYDGYSQQGLNYGASNMDGLGIGLDDMSNGTSYGHTSNTYSVNGSSNHPNMIPEQYNGTNNHNHHHQHNGTNMQELNPYSRNFNSNSNSNGNGLSHGNQSGQPGPSMNSFSTTNSNSSGLSLNSFYNYDTMCGSQGSTASASIGTASSMGALSNHTSTFTSPLGSPKHYPPGVSSNVGGMSNMSSIGLGPHNQGSTGLNLNSNSSISQLPHHMSNSHQIANINTMNSMNPMSMNPNAMVYRSANDGYIDTNTNMNSSSITNPNIYCEFNNHGMANSNAIDSGMANGMANSNAIDSGGSNNPNNILYSIPPPPPLSFQHSQSSSSPEYQHSPSSQNSNTNNTNNTNNSSNIHSLYELNLTGNSGGKSDGRGSRSGSASGSSTNSINTNTNTNSYLGTNLENLQLSHIDLSGAVTVGNISNNGSIPTITHNVAPTNDESELMNKMLDSMASLVLPQDD